MNIDFECGGENVGNGSFKSANHHVLEGIRLLFKNIPPSSGHWHPGPAANIDLIITKSVGSLVFQ